MSNEFESFQTVPELTLEPFAEEKAVEVKKQEQVFDDSILSEEERRAVQAFAAQIEIGRAHV